LGFLLKAFGSMFIIAGVSASNMPKINRSLTWYRKMDDPGWMPDAAIWSHARQQFA
jgi:hypothetical protein